MIFGGLQKWEIGLIAGVTLAAGVWEIVGRFVRMPFAVGVSAYALSVAVLCLWRPVVFLISYPRLKKHGERAEAVVAEYRRVNWGVGSGVAEVIRFADKNGRKREKLLHTMPMLSRRVGRRYALYYDDKNEDAFFISPQCFFAVAAYTALWALAELPAVILLLLYNGG